MKKLIAFFLTGLLSCSLYLQAQKTDEMLVAKQVETLRTLLLAPEKAALEAIAADALTYGHSVGFIEDKAEFIDDLLSGKSRFKQITISNQSITISGDVAIVRQHFVGSTVSGPVSTIDIIVLMTWQKQKGQWKLLARQGAKIPVAPAN